MNIIKLLKRHRSELAALASIFTVLGATSTVCVNLKVADHVCKKAPEAVRQHICPKHQG
jgi:hypothetical protein